MDAFRALRVVLNVVVPEATQEAVQRATAAEEAANEANARAAVATTRAAVAEQTERRLWDALDVHLEYEADLDVDLGVIAREIQMTLGLDPPQILGPVSGMASLRRTWQDAREAINEMETELRRARAEIERLQGRRARRRQ